MRKQDEKLWVSLLNWLGEFLEFPQNFTVRIPNRKLNHTENFSFREFTSQPLNETQNHKAKQSDFPVKTERLPNKESKQAEAIQFNQPTNQPVLTDWQTTKKTR